MAHHPTHLHSEDLRRFFDLARDMVAVAAPDGRFIYVNPEWEKVLGWSPAELMARPFLEFVHPDDVERTHEKAAAIFEGKEAIQFENRYQCADGSYRWLQWNSRLDQQSGNIYGVTRDITELRRLEKSRVDLLHNIAHDLAGSITPLELRLAVVRGIAGEAAQKQLDKVEINVAHLHHLVEDVKDVLSLERNELKLTMQRTALAPLVYDVVGMYPEVEPPQLHVAVDDGIELEVDAHRMKRVLINLVHNARKFTPIQGNVAVKGWTEDSIVRLAVTDTGRGLEPDEQTRIFEAFTQVHEPGSVKERGTGLGLYICKGIVEGHGGRIWVESSGRGEGSAFHIALPQFA